MIDLHFTAATAVMAGLGFLLHFLGRWAEYWRTGGKVGPAEYVRQDPPGWAFATIATVAAYLVLPEIGGLLGAPSITTTPGGALAASYMASSLGAKLPAILGRGPGIR